MPAAPKKNNVGAVKAAVRARSVKRQVAGGKGGRGRAKAPQRRTVAGLKKTVVRRKDLTAAQRVGAMKRLNRPQHAYDTGKKRFFVNKKPGTNATIAAGAGQVWITRSKGKGQSTLRSKMAICPSLRGEPKRSPQIGSGGAPRCGLPPKRKRAAPKRAAPKRAAPKRAAPKRAAPKRLLRVAAAPKRAGPKRAPSRWAVATGLAHKASPKPAWLKVGQKAGTKSHTFVRDIADYLEGGMKQKDAVAQALRDSRRG